MSIWPQITFAAILFFSAGIQIQKTTSVSDLGTTLAANALTFWLLYMGGFWHVLGIG